MIGCIKYEESCLEIGSIGGKSSRYLREISNKILQNNCFSNNEYFLVVSSPNNAVECLEIILS